MLHCVRQSLVVVPGAGALIGRPTENIPSLFAAEFLAIGFGERWCCGRQFGTGQQVVNNMDRILEIFTSNLSASEKEDTIYRFVNDECDRGMSPALFASFLKFSLMLICE